MRLIGIFLIVASVLAPAIWFAELAQTRDPIALFSQYLGVCALIVMGYAQLLATRIWGLETVFGGLDRIYVLHKWLGIAAIVFVLLHDTIDAEMDRLGRETIVSEVAETLGEVSLYGLLVLTTLSIATFVPYHLWKYTHKLMGGFFAASALHYLFIQKPFGNLDALGLYVSAFCLIGVVAYAYTLLPLDWLKGWRRYRVIEVEPTGDALAVTLEPEGRGFRHVAGQFAFLQLEVPGFTERHPFTISQAPQADRSLRFTIKALGDYTGNLAEMMKPGTGAKVSGPFGHFRLPKRGPQVWIAAGVGVTPFMAWAEALDPKADPIQMFYCARDRKGAPHLLELEALAAQKPNLILHFVESSRGERLSAEQIAKSITTDRHSTRLAFCGPAAMRLSLQKQLAGQGFRSGNFHYEVFEIRSGIGLAALSDWLLKRVSNRLPAAFRRS